MLRRALAVILGVGCTLVSLWPMGASAVSLGGQLIYDNWNKLVQVQFGTPLGKIIFVPGESETIAEHALSMSGARFCFVTGNAIRLGVVGRNGSSPLVEAPNGMMASSPAWSPDGKFIAYVLKDPTTQESRVWITPIKGKGASAISGLPAQDVAHPCFSPDGKRLAFSASQSLWTISADGGRPQEILPAGAKAVLSDGSLPNISTPVWSTTNRIAFVLGSGDNTVLCIVKPDGSDLQKIDRYKKISSPCWSPGGEYLAFLKPGGLTIIAPDGREVFSILGVKPTHLAWSR